MKQLIEDIGRLSDSESDLQAGCEQAPRLSLETNTGQNRKLYIESYGCQMNYSDSEIVTAILAENGFDTTNDADRADLILLNTCAIRDNAEQKIRHRLQRLNFIKKQKPEVLIGVLGCMAERLKLKLLEQEQIVDMVVGPDAYRDLPRLIAQAGAGERSVNVFLSREETYDDIVPVRLNTNGISAFISIMRGCDNMCSFCVVPFTRGRERSRDPKTIVAEAQDLFDKGYREVTLLGQNVDSYKWQNEANAAVNTTGLPSFNFANLLDKVALVSPLLRIRFSTSHPKDLTDEVIYTMARHENICKYIHLPAQSGSDRILEIMNRGYSRAWYLDRIASIKRILGPDCAISTDIISGFCSETEQDHQQTLSLMEQVDYDYAYMFAYSERPNTPAAKKYPDDVSEQDKKNRLTEIIALQRKMSLVRNKAKIGKVYQVLVEGVSRKSDLQLSGRISENAVVVFDRLHHQKGDYLQVLITDCTGGTLIGKIV